MPHLHFTRTLQVGLVLVSAQAAAVQAGVISDVIHPSSEPTPWTFEPNNNDVASSNLSGNFGELDLVLTEHAPFDAVVAVTDSGGVSEYDLFGNVTNSSGHTWSGLSIELGFGTDGGFVTAALDDLDFDTPEANSAVVYTLGAQSLPPTTHTATLIEWADAVTISGNSPGYRFHLDVPDSNSTQIPLGALTTDGYNLTMRVTPLPEPGTGTFALAAGIGLLLRRPRQRMVTAEGTFIGSRTT